MNYYALAMVDERRLFISRMAFTVYGIICFIAGLVYLVYFFILADSDVCNKMTWKMMGLIGIYLMVFSVIPIVIQNCFITRNNFMISLIAMFIMNCLTVILVWVDYVFDAPNQELCYTTYTTHIIANVVGLMAYPTFAAIAS